MEAHKKIIDFISKHRRFYLSCVMISIGISRRQALQILGKFKKEGYLTEVKVERIPLKLNEYGPARRNPQYKVIKDILMRKQKLPVCDRDKIWKTLRYLREFTRSDLIRLTGCTKTVEDYTRLLSRHGYIRSLGQHSREKIWTLVKDIGPKRPHIPEGS